jgi:hypothetical protein
MSAKEKLVVEHLEKTAIYERAISSDAIYEEIVESLDHLRDRHLSSLIETIRAIQVDRESTRIVDSVS